MRILIIEDDPDIVEFVSKTLQNESYAVDLAQNGLAGEELAFSEEYDLIILDLLIPGKDGISVLRTLRKSGLTLPVLILTAKSSVSDRVIGLDSGADDYLVKPFAVAELRARVRALLRRNSGEKQVELTAGDLTLNPSSHRVSVAGTEIELTSREYAILEYLLRNKNRLLSKGMIAEHVWDYHFDSDYNLIEVYIKRLRQKIERSRHPKLIHTVRNSGYILREPEDAS
jgi:DNA-binding response OmpR family regulator